MVRKIRYLLLSVGISLLSFQVAARTVIPVELKNGKALKVAVYEYTNSNGHRELRFETDNAASIILGHARDFDLDGKIDTFFIFGDDGVAKYRRSVSGETTLEASKIILAKHAKYSGADYFTSIGMHILNFFFLAVDHINEAHKTWYKDWMDGEHFAYVIEKNKAGLSRDELIYSYRLILEHSQQSFMEYEKAFYKAYPAWWLADVTLWLSGGALVKWVGKGVARLGKKISPRIQKLGGAVTTRIGAKATMGFYRGQLHTAMKAITTKGLFSKTKGAMLKGFSNIRAEWKFLTYSTGIQLGVESFVNYSEIYDPDPKMMAKKMYDHPDIRENISISVVDNLAMAAAHGAAQTRVGKYALMGIVGASSSFGVGVGVSGSQAKERITFDAAWALGVDSLQMMLDLHVLHKFESLAIKAKNPKLKFVGYAIVFVSQVAGYYGYSQASSYFDPNLPEEGELKLIPVHVNHF